MASRDGAVMAFRPFGKELEFLWSANLNRGVGRDDLPGPYMATYFRAAGFDVDGGKVTVGAGTTVYAGREKTEWWARTLAGRLEKGEKYRESWVKVGISEDKCDECIELLKKWGSSQDAWYALLQSEIIATK